MLYWLSHSCDKIHCPKKTQKTDLFRLTVQVRFQSIMVGKAQRLEGLSPQHLHMVKTRAQKRHDGTRGEPSLQVSHLWPILPPPNQHYRSRITKQHQLQQLGLCKAEFCKLLSTSFSQKFYSFFLPEMIGACPLVDYPFFITL